MLSKLVSALHESGSAPEMPLSLALLQQDWMRHYIVEHKYVVVQIEGQIEGQRANNKLQTSLCGFRPSPAHTAHILISLASVLHEGGSVPDRLLLPTSLYMRGNEVKGSFI